MISAVICVLLRGFWHLRKQWLELFESTELISYLLSYLFLQRHCSFTSRKLYTSLSSEILIFLSAIILIELMFFKLVTTRFKCNCWHASLLNVSLFSWVKTMVSTLHVDLISYRYFYNTLYVWSWYRNSYICETVRHLRLGANLSWLQMIIYSKL